MNSAEPNSPSATNSAAEGRRSTSAAPLAGGRRAGDPALRLESVTETIASAAHLAAAGVPDRALRAFQHALELADEPGQVAEIYRRIGATHRALGHWQEALVAVRRSGAVATSAGLTDAAAEAANAEGNVHLAHGQVAEARPCYERGIASNPAPRIRAMLLQNLGTCAAHEGDASAAREHFTEALEGFRAAGDERGVITALNNLAVNRMEAGEWAAALPHITEVIRLAHHLGDLELQLTAACNQAAVLAHLGQLEEAQACLSEPMGFFHSAGNQMQRGQCLRVLGDVYAAYETADHDDSARRCYALARALYLEADAPHFVGLIDGAVARLDSRTR